MLICRSSTLTICKHIRHTRTGMASHAHLPITSARLPMCGSSVLICSTHLLICAHLSITFTHLSRHGSSVLMCPSHLLTNPGMARLPRCGWLLTLKIWPMMRTREPRRSIIIAYQPSRTNCSRTWTDTRDSRASCCLHMCMRACVHVCVHVLEKQIDR